MRRRWLGKESILLVREGPVMASMSVGESFEERLERGEVVLFPHAPFVLPGGADHAFLLEQQIGSVIHKNISYNPRTSQATGFARRDDGQQQRLEQVLGDFSRVVATWLADALPRYRTGLEVDRVSFRPEEEATRRLRHNARNDLLHVDAFPGRPARGRRILRLFTNIHPSEPRIWITSEPLPRLLPRYREQIARRFSPWWRALLSRMVDLVSRPESRRSESDRFMLELHDFLKSSHDFQRHGVRHLWRFPPGSAWLAMTDGCTYAELRGQFALEHSFFVRPEVLLRPDLAPEALLRAG